MKILHVTPSYYPASYWGGPIWSTKAICDGIATRPGFDLRVLTTDAAGPSLRQRVTPARLPYPVCYTWRQAGHSIAPGLVARLPRAIAWADLVHLTGVYNTPTLPVFALCRAVGRPLIWSPRGSLLATQDWRDVPKKRLKQGFARILRAVAPANAVMHVTATAEAAAGAAAFPAMRRVVVPNAVDLPIHVPNRIADPQVFRLLYLGRLHQKKGLEPLIAAMSRLPARFRLDICGTGDAAYVAALRRLATPLGARVRFHGHVAGAAKTRAFASSDLFVLPSFTENFGIAVAEALAHALPVLTTDATPWTKVAEVGCGAVITMGRDDLATAIMALATADLPAMGQRGRRWMQRDFATDAMVSAFAEVYASLAQPKVQQVSA